MAAQRRALPSGGEIPEDYVFEAVVGSVCTWQGYACDLQLNVRTGEERPCPGLHALPRWPRRSARHICQHINLAVVAKSPLPRILSFAEESGCALPNSATAGNAYDRTTSVNSSRPRPSRTEAAGLQGWRGTGHADLNVFRRGGDGIFHFWGSER